MSMLRLTLGIALGVGVTLAALTGMAVVVPPADAPMLAFTSYRDNNFDVYLLDVNQGRLLNLSDDPADDYMPAWSADGRRLAWVSERDGGRDLYLYDFADASLHRLTFDTQATYANPAWGPDGEALAYVRFDASPVPALVITRVDAANRLRPGAQVNFGNGPQWSPDGSQIAYLNQYGADYFINLVNADGSNARQMSINVRQASRFDWSPDGRTILYDGTGTPGVPGQVMRLDVRDGYNTPLMPFGEGGFDAQYAPDGEQIVFVRQERAQADLYLMDALGRDAQRLTDGAISAHAPVWSPDGAYIAFLGAASSGTAENVYVMTLNNGKMRQLTDDPARDFGIVWRP